MSKDDKVLITEREKIKYDLVFDWNIKNSEKEKKEQNVTK